MFLRNNKTGLNSALYGNVNDTEETLILNQDWSVNYWIQQGCPPDKIVLGLAAYGRSFKLKDSNSNGIFSRTFANPGIGGNFTKTSGHLSFFEICQIKKEPNWNKIWLPKSKAFYMYNKDDWVSYDDLESFRLKTAYIVAKKLGGVFIWSIDMDDFTGKFCGLGSFPLIKNRYVKLFYKINLYI